MLELISSSLERVSEIAGDPTPLVYKRLFEQHPELQDLFILDKTDGAKGQMLSEAFDCIFDHLAEDHYASNFIECERINHDGIGVSPEIFNSFFALVKEVCAEVMGSEWQPETEAAWAELLDSLGVSATFSH